MKDYKQKAVESAEFLFARTNINPEIGMVTGTGLGEMVRSFDRSESFQYKDIPHFSVPTVESHRGRLLIGNMQGKQVIALQGRFHLYEGYSPLAVTFPIRVMQELGVKVLILSNASGGLNPEFHPGDIMIITDHINLTGSNPLIGPNEPSWGIRFPDMGRAYDQTLMRIAEKTGEETGNRLRKGVYAGLAGPSLETPAEVHFLRTIGADAVGFSTVQEVISAVHSEMRILGLSIITNIHNPDNPAPLIEDDIIAAANDAVPELKAVISGVVSKVDDHESN